METDGDVDTSAFADWVVDVGATFATVVVGVFDKVNNLRWLSISSKYEISLSFKLAPSR